MDFVAEWDFFGEGIQFFIEDPYWVSMVEGDPEQYSMESILLFF